MVCPTVDCSWQSLKASSLNQLPGCQDPEWSGIGVLQPSPPWQPITSFQWVPWKWNGGRGPGWGCLSWFGFCKKGTGFWASVKVTTQAKFRLQGRREVSKANRFFSKLLPAGSVKEPRQENFHGKRNIKEKGCVGGAIFQGHAMRTHRPDAPCPHLLPHCHHQARRPREKKGKRSTAKDLCWRWKGKCCQERWPAQITKAF